MYLVRWLFYQDRRKPRSKGAIITPSSSPLPSELNPFKRILLLLASPTPPVFQTFLRPCMYMYTEPPFHVQESNEAMAKLFVRATKPRKKVNTFKKFLKAETVQPIGMSLEICWKSFSQIRFLGHLIFFAPICVIVE